MGTSLTAMFQPSLTQAYTICGTPDYMAPEVISGKGYMFPADWWSLGVLVFEVMTGRMPFKNKMVGGIYMQGASRIKAIKSRATCDWLDLARGLCEEEPSKRL